MDEGTVRPRLDCWRRKERKSEAFGHFKGNLLSLSHCTSRRNDLRAADNVPNWNWLAKESANEALQAFWSASSSDHIADQWGRTTSWTRAAAMWLVRSWGRGVPTCIGRLGAHKADEVDILARGVERTLVFFAGKMQVGSKNRASRFRRQDCPRCRRESRSSWVKLPNGASTSAISCVRKPPRSWGTSKPASWRNCSAASMVKKEEAAAVELAMKQKQMKGDRLGVWTTWQRCKWNAYIHLQLFREYIMHPTCLPIRNMFAIGHQALELLV